ISRRLSKQYCIVSSTLLTTSLVTPLPCTPLLGLAKTTSIFFNHSLAFSLLPLFKSNLNISLFKYLEKTSINLFLLIKISAFFLLFNFFKHIYKFISLTYFFLLFFFLLLYFMINLYNFILFTYVCLSLLPLL